MKRFEAGGVIALINSGGLRVIAPQMSDLPDGSHAMEVAIKILQLLVSKLSRESMNIERFLERSLVVAAVAHQFAVMHNALKFEALHLLSVVFCSEYSVSIQSLTFCGKLAVIGESSFMLIVNLVAV
ncbi:unnamed protein product [Thlaspi arvense]|uniref:Uncharacterized protein n=1 Tax=Thlaspi arvense TaxID=13288 RepID=A0AAU9SPF3_THLAR|nr:unnamed protein product [Thlaspi arvense]